MLSEPAALLAELRGQVTPATQVNVAATEAVPIQEANALQPINEPLPPVTTDLDPVGMLQFCVPVMDDLDCFVDADDGHSHESWSEEGCVASHWFEECNMNAGEVQVSDWSDDLSVMSCYEDIADFDKVDNFVVKIESSNDNAQAHVSAPSLPSNNSFLRLPSCRSFWTMIVFCWLLTCFDVNSVTISMSLSTTMFALMKHMVWWIQLKSEVWLRDKCVTGGFKCYPSTLMTLSCVMVTMWIVGMLCDPRNCKLSFKSILETLGLINNKSRLRLKKNNFFLS